MEGNPGTNHIIFFNGLAATLANVAEHRWTLILISRCLRCGFEDMCENPCIGIRARSFKLLRSPRTDSKESILPAYVAWAGIFKESMWPRKPRRNRVIVPARNYDRKPFLLPFVYSFTPLVFEHYARQQKDYTIPIENEYQSAYPFVRIGSPRPLYRGANSDDWSGSLALWPGPNPLRIYSIPVACHSSLPRLREYFFKKYS
jgi:hypothetical protein